MKKFLSITFGLILFFFAGIFLLQSVYSDKFRRRAEAEIDKRVQADVQFSRISFSMFRHFPSFTLTLHGLHVIGKDTFAGDTLASAEKIHIGVNLWRLIRHEEIEIKDLEMEKLVLDIRVLKNGATNYNIFESDTSSTQAADTTSSLGIAMDKIEIKNAQITYDDRALNTYLEVHDFNYEGTGDFEKEIFDLNSDISATNVTCDFGEVRYLAHKVVKASMVLEMNLKDNEFTFKKNTFQINHFKFGLDGSFTMLPNGYDMNLKFATQETAFKNVLSLVPGVYMENMKEISTKGDLEFKGFVKGQYLDSSDRIPAFHVAIKVSNASFKVDTLPMPIENINLDLVMENKSGIPDSTVIDLRNFHMDINKHLVHGRLRWQGLSKEYKVDADILADLDLAELEKIYPIKGVDLKGKLNFELKANGGYENDGKISRLPPFHLKLQLADGRLKYDSLPRAVENIQFHLLADNTTGKIEHTVFQFRQIHMDLGKNPIHGYATIEGFGHFKVDADLDAKLDLADVAQMYPVQGFAMKGLFDLDVNLKGVYDAEKKLLPAIDARMNLSNGWLKSDDYPEPLENVSMKLEALNNDGNYKDTRLNIQALNYTLEGEPFSVTGTVNDLDDYAYDLKVKGKVDLAKFTRIYPVEGMSLAGIIETDVETQGKISDLEAGRYKRIKSSGKIEVEDFLLKSPSIPKPIAISDALFTFTPQKIILERFKAKFGKSNVSITGDLSNYMAFVPGTGSHASTKNQKRKPITGDMVLTMDTLDVNEWMTDQKATAAAPAPATGNAKPADSTAMKMIILPERWDFTFDSKIGYIRYADLFIKDLDGEIRVKDQVLSLKETGFNTLNALFNVTGDYNTKDTLHPLFDFDLDIKELDINKAYRESQFVRNMMSSAANAYGKVSLTYSLKGELDQHMNVKTETLTGGGELRIANAQIDGMKIFEEVSKTAKKENMNDPNLKDFVMKTEIRDNKIFVKPFSLKVSGFNTDIEGVSDLNGAIQYVIKVELLPLEKIKIPFHVSGTYDNPKVAIGKGHKLPGTEAATEPK